MYKKRLISAAEARRIDANLKQPGSELLHPIAAIARNLPTHAKLETKINLEQLCEWFAEQCEIPYYHIDPLNIEIATVTAVVAPDYAKQNGLLAVEANQDSVTLAVKNPLDLSWKENLSGLLRKDPKTPKPLYPDPYILNGKRGNC